MMSPCPSSSLFAKTPFARAFPRRLLTACAGTLLLLSLGCGDDSAGPEPTPDVDFGDWAAPPEPTSPGNQMPSVTTAKIDRSAALDNFAPRVESLAVIRELNRAAYWPLNSTQSGDWWKCESAHCDIVVDGALVEPSWNLFWRLGPDWIPAVQIASAAFTDLGTFTDPVSHETHHYYLSDKSVGLGYIGVVSTGLAAGLVAGGGLVNIGSAQENEFLKTALQALALSDAWVYVGYWKGNCTCHPSGWHWEFGDDTSYRNFKSGEPDGDDFAAMFILQPASGEVAGQWHGRNKVADVYRFVLETERPLPSLQAVGPQYSTSTSFFGHWTDVSEIPAVRRETYWKRLVQATIASGAAQELQLTATLGISETRAEQASRTLRKEGGVEWTPLEGLTISGSISSELTRLLSHEVKVYQESERTDWFKSGESPAGKTREWIVWQRAERYVISNADNSNWSHPGIELVPDTDQGGEVLLEQGLNSYYVYTKDF